MALSGAAEAASDLHGTRWRGTLARKQRCNPTHSLRQTMIGSILSNKRVNAPIGAVADQEQAAAAIASKARMDRSLFQVTWRVSRSSAGDVFLVETPGGVVSGSTTSAHRGLHAARSRCATQATLTYAAGSLKEQWCHRPLDPCLLRRAGLQSEPAESPRYWNPKVLFASTRVPSAPTDSSTSTVFRRCDTKRHVGCSAGTLGPLLA